MLPRRLLELVGARASQPGSQAGRLARATTTVEPCEPEVFLRRAPGVPRVFWELGEAWSAGVGAAATIALRAPIQRQGETKSANGVNGHGGLNGDAGAPPTRLEHASERTAVLRAKADALLASIASDEQGPPPRLYGGLAFHPEHEATGAWQAFPTARFQLPALELTATPEATRLSATVRIPSGESRRAGQGLAEQALDQALQVIAQPPPKGPSEHAIPTLAGTSPRRAWDEAVGEVLARIEKGQLAKAVLARTLDLDAPSPPDPTVLLGNLRRENPGTTVHLFEPEPGAVLVGASPELIGTVRGEVFEGQAVAGSVPRGTSEAEDQRLARHLASNAKDRAEHQLVVDDMRKRLRAISAHVEVGRETAVLRLNRVQHLERSIYARLKPGQHILDVVEQLHPTPAVCGTPTQPARQLLSRLEPFERGWYAGPVGWFDARGDGAFAPSLRCALLTGQRWRLFAGAGLVDGSQAQAEWDETRLKLEPVARALGVPEVP